MSDSNIENLEENEEYEKKEDEQNVVINIEPKGRKPRKKMSPEDHAAMLERLRKGREAAHAKRRALESTVKMKKIEKLQDEIDKAQNDPIITTTNKKELKEQRQEDEVKDLTIVKKKKKKKVIIQESGSSSDEEIIVRRKSKSRQASPPPLPTPPPVARRPPPSAQERQAVIERAEASRKMALQVAQQKARQDQMMKSIFG